jgi:hypothetical protein
MGQTTYESIAVYRTSLEWERMKVSKIQDQAKAEKGRVANQGKQSED